MAIYYIIGQILCTIHAYHIIILTSNMCMIWSWALPDLDMYLYVDPLACVGREKQGRISDQGRPLMWIPFLRSAFPTEILNE